MIWNDYKSIIQPIDLSKITSQNIQLSILREDLIHSEISGNKYRKLKYNFLEAEKLGFNKIITFGGAFSNHIAATAAAGKEYGFETIGIIRGEELANKIALQIAANSPEYIDIAKSYSTAKSASFINGILDAVVKELKDELLKLQEQYNDPVRFSPERDKE